MSFLIAIANIFFNAVLFFFLNYNGRYNFDQEENYPSQMGFNT